MRQWETQIEINNKNKMPHFHPGNERFAAGYRIYRGVERVQTTRNTIFAVTRETRVKGF